VSKRGRGEKCTYCKRTLEAMSSLSRVAATKDHIIPKSKGGRQTVWACRQCNAIKGDMEPDVWAAFMADWPEWWKHPEFLNHGRGGWPVQYAKDHPKVLARGPKFATLADTKGILQHGKKAWRQMRDDTSEPTNA
jgi:HNH endonuclease